MKLLFKIVFLALLISACSKPIILKDAKVKQSGRFSYLKNTEVSPVVNLNISDSLKLLWNSQTHGSFYNSAPVLYDYYLFVPDLSGRLYCFNDSTGKELGFEKFKGEISIAPIIENNTIIFGVNEYRENFATLYFLNFITGDYENELTVKGNLTNEMIKLTDGIIILTQQGRVLKIGYDGEKKWEYESHEFALGDPFYIDGLIIFATVKGNIFGIDAGFGEEKFIYELSSRFESSPVAKDNTIYLVDIDGTFFSFDYDNDIVNWTFEGGNASRMQPVIINETIYYGDLHGNIYLLNKNTGELIWKLETDGVFNASPIIFTNKIIQPDLNKKLLLIDREQGYLRKIINYDARVRLSPIFYDGRLIIGTDRGEIFAYSIMESL